MRISDWSSDVCSSDLTPPARTPEITPLLHMHALVFTLWTCLIVVQPLLIAKGAIGIHRRLGIAGAGLAVLVWIFGNLAAAEAIEAGYKGLGDPYAFYAITFFSIQARSEEHTSELQSLMRTSYAVFRLKTKNRHTRL